MSQIEGKYVDLSRRVSINLTSQILYTFRTRIMAPSSLQNVSGKFRIRDENNAIS